MRESQFKEDIMEGANVVTEGLGSSTMTTEGYGYVPRATGAIRPALQRGLAEMPALLHLKSEVANAFSFLRTQFGEEVSVEALWEAIDEVLLAQPGIYKQARLEGLSPAVLAQMAYEGER